MATTWLSTARAKILEEQREIFETTDGPARRNVLLVLKTELQRAPGRKLPRKLTKAIEAWYRGDNENNDNTEQLHFTQSWNLLRVVQHKMIKEINEEIEHKPGSKEYMSQFRRVSGNIAKNLPTDVKREYLALVDQWNNEQPPEDVQRRQAQKSLAHSTNKFAEEVHRQMGAKVLILGAWLGEDNEINLSFHETDKTSETSFYKLYKREHKKIRASFTAWARQQFDEADSEDDSTQEDGITTKASVNSCIKGRRKPKLSFETDNNGHAMLPILEKQLELPKLKELIRSFVTQAYRHFTHNTMASVPWANIKDLEWFSAGSWVGHVSFVDPSKLKEVEARAVYQDWVLRQRKNLVPFKFIKALDRDVRVDGVDPKPQGRKGKGKKPFVDVSSSEDDESNEDEDEDKSDAANDDEDEEAPEPVPISSGRKRKRVDEEDLPGPSVKEKRLSSAAKGKSKETIETIVDDNTEDRPLLEIEIARPRPLPRQIKIGEAGPSQVVAPSQKKVPRLLNVPRADEPPLTVSPKKKNAIKVQVRVPKSHVVTRSKADGGIVTRQKTTRKKSG